MVFSSVLCVCVTRSESLTSYARKVILATINEDDESLTPEKIDNWFGSRQKTPSIHVIFCSFCVLHNKTAVQKNRFVFIVDYFVEYIVIILA